MRVSHEVLVDAPHHDATIYGQVAFPSHNRPTPPTVLPLILTIFAVLGASLK